MAVDPPSRYVAPVVASAFRAAVLALVRLYYPAIGRSGPALPAGPVLVVANHPNGLLDPLLVSLAARRRLAFLAKSTFWDQPASRWAMEAFGALPVYRAHEADPRQNEATFAACRALLAGGGGLALFPEGKSHDAPELQPLKTGAARIALGAEAEAGWTLGLRVVPVGLFYEDKAVFRTRVAARAGEGLRVADWKEAWETDPRAAVTDLTARLGDTLGALLVSAETEEVRRGLAAVAAWTDPAARDDVGARAELANRLAAAWRGLRAEDPVAAEALADRVRAFAARLRAAGVDDPWTLDAPVPHPLRAALPLLGLLPLAVVGTALAWVPYRAVRPLAERLARGHVDIVGTLKLLLGTAVLVPVYLGWALLAAGLLHPLAGLATLLVGPVTGLAALRFDEAWALRRGLLFRPAADVARALAAERDTLAEAVRAAVSSSAATGAPRSAP